MNDLINQETETPTDARESDLSMRFSTYCWEITICNMSKIFSNISNTLLWRLDIPWMWSWSAPPELESGTKPHIVIVLVIIIKTLSIITNLIVT